MVPNYHYIVKWDCLIESEMITNNIWQKFFHEQFIKQSQVINNMNNNSNFGATKMLGTHRNICVWVILVKEYHTFNLFLFIVFAEILDIIVTFAVIDESGKTFTLIWFDKVQITRTKWKMVVQLSILLRFLCTAHMKTFVMFGIFR